MEEKKRVENWIEDNREAMVGFLQDLVRIPSVNPWFSDYKVYTTEKEAQEFIAEALSGMGFQVDLWEVNPDELKQYEGMPGYYEGRPMKDRPICAAPLKAQAEAGPFS